jgi:hypothetical protein
MADSGLCVVIASCFTEATLQFHDEGFNFMFRQVQRVSVGTHRDNADGRTIEPGI